jgi:diguanylate cyclase
VRLGQAEGSTMPEPEQYKAATQYARDIAIQSIELLLAHDLLPTPLNYAVSYEYLQGNLAELKRLLDNHMLAGRALDNILLQDLYDKYIATERHKEFQGLRNNLQDLLQALLHTISETNSNSIDYQRELESSMEKLDQDQDQDALQAIAADMIAATVAANTQNGKLQAHLATAQSETEQLRAELEAQRREAMIDPLTGLFNRRAMDIHLNELWQTESECLSILVMDIDHFKLINDSYGHAIGDIVIRNVAEAMRKCIRGEDIAIRYGGEEFLVLLPNTPLEGAITVAESIRKRIEALRLVRKTDNFVLAPFTISLGVAERHGDDDRDSLFERADKALYHSKSSGRNRVTHENSLH